MQLPRDLLSGEYTAPRFFLCEVDKTIICQLDAYNRNGEFKFNSLSKISFNIDRTYNSFFDAQNVVNPFYDKVEALRLIYIEGFGYFEIQGPKLSSDGIKEYKEVEAYSLEYTLSQKYLSDFYINTGEIGSVEVTAATGGNIIPVTLYNEQRKDLSLLHLILEKAYGWSIGHVDEQLKTLSRTFEVDRMSIYDFITNEICEKFNCFIVFDTINNTINVYAESQTEKFIGDGKTKEFIISPPFYKIGTVSIDGYKTTQWDYNSQTGILTIIGEAPDRGSHIEVVDDSLTPWETDVFVSFENLSDSMDISYDADDIKTMLYVKYGDGNDIREINTGLPYLTDISYYCTPEWMGSRLYNSYNNYISKCNEVKIIYSNNSKKLQDISGLINFETNRLTLGYSETYTSPETVGTYYVRGGSEPEYYYTEVSLPADYNANVQYYKMNGSNLNEDKVLNFYVMLKKYFVSEFKETLEDGKTDVDWEKDAKELESDFNFVKDQYIDLINYLKSQINRSINPMVRTRILLFLSKLWEEVGKEPLKSLYQGAYKKIQTTNISAGWSEENHDNYLSYYPVTIMLESIEDAIAYRDFKIATYRIRYKVLQEQNIELANSIALGANFTEQELIILNAFFREDELHLDDIIETEYDSVLDTFKNKQHAMESARIELSKISQPKLKFNMSMANIYAMEEFEPIINQFQLGNVIKVALRNDYIKQSRLLGVNINFDDLSDFSSEFGDLTNLKTQSDIHADLLAGAITAGKQVATNSSYWTQGADRVTQLGLNLQNGLLDTVDALKSMDATQNAYIDKYGIHLESDDPENKNKIWMVNDKIVFTDDNFKTSKSVFGKYIYRNGDVEENRYGLMAEYVNAGVVEGCQMVGGTIQIGAKEDGSYAFEVKADGSVHMNGGGSGYATTDDINKAISNTKVIISSQEPSNPTYGQLWLDTSQNKSVLKVYKQISANNGMWVECSEQDGKNIFTSKPSSYSDGDLWILSAEDSSELGKYSDGTILKAIQSSTTFNIDHWIDTDITGTQLKQNMEQYFEFNQNTGLKIGQKDEKFYVQLDSQEMGFYERDENNNAQKVVSISNNSATIRNLSVEKSTIFECNGNAYFKEEINLFDNFILKKEEDGSISLAVST